MYNQQKTSVSPAVSQYQGIQKSYQPTGFVQSVYGQNNLQQQNRANTAFQTSAFSNVANQFQGQFQGQTGQYGYQNQTPQSFHAANYRGNQAGHDNYLRADSTQPSQFGTGFTNVNPAASQYAAKANIQSTAFAGQYQQQQTPQSFHAANYQGNQAGHDNYLRADSQQPTNQTAAIGGYGSVVNQGINAYAGSFQAQNPQSFHLANYQGNQPGHDQQLRADAIQPSNIQTGNIFGQR